MLSDCPARDSNGTSKKLQSCVKLAVGRADHDIAAVLEGSSIEDRRRTNRIDARGFVVLSRDPAGGLELLDKTARCGAADRVTASDPVASSLERRRVANHQERT